MIINNTREHKILTTVQTWDQSSHKVKSLISGPTTTGLDIASPALNSSSETGSPLWVMKGSLSRKGMHFTCDVQLHEDQEGGAST